MFPCHTKRASRHPERSIQNHIITDFRKQKGDERRETRTNNQHRRKSKEHTSFVSRVHGVFCSVQSVQYLSSFSFQPCTYKSYWVPVTVHYKVLTKLFLHNIRPFHLQISILPLCRWLIEKRVRLQLTGYRIQYSTGSYHDSRRRPSKKSSSANSELTANRELIESHHKMSTAPIYHPVCSNIASAVERGTKERVPLSVAIGRGKREKLDALRVD